MKGKSLTGIAIREAAFEWTTLRSGDKAGGACVSQSAALETGETRDLGALAIADSAALATLFKPHTSSMSGAVSLAVPASWVLVRILTMPAAAPAEMRDMVELQMDKFSPFPLENMQISYEILNERDGQVRIIAAAISTEKIDALGSAFQAAGITIDRVDINTLGWWQIVRDLPDVIPDTGAQLCVFRDGAACDFILTHDRQPVVFRALGALESLTPEEQDEEIVREVIATLTGLEIDVGTAPVPVTLFYLDPVPEGLLGLLRQSLEITPKAYPLTEGPALSWGIVMRAAASADGILNLAPPSWKQAQRAIRTRRRLITASIAAGALWLIALATLFGLFYREKSQSQSIQDQIKTLTAPAEYVHITQGRVLALEQYLDRSHSALECLLEVTRALPEGIELKSYMYRKGKQVEVAGMAGSVNMVYDFKKAMDDSQLFAGAELPRTSKGPDGRESFKMTFKFAEGGDE